MTDELTEEEISQRDTAYNLLKKNRDIVIDTYANKRDYISDPAPVTLFMAGSPGAGKTEVSKRLIARFKNKPVRIDADEIRTLCEGYEGKNAHIFQRAATKGVQILYDTVLSRSLNAILDGTFAYANAMENIENSLKKGRKVEIYFVYQNPLQAWDFTKKREKLEQRRVVKSVFINAYFKSIDNVNLAKSKFGRDVELNLMIKDFEKNLERLELNIEKVDHYFPKIYTKEELEELLV